MRQDTERSASAAGGCGEERQGARQDGVQGGAASAHAADGAPEEMAAFFERRLDIYEEHQLHAIEGAALFYRRTADCLPARAGAEVLDLGCGTGLELGFYYAVNPTARLTCVDLSARMLAVLREKFARFSPRTVCASYFDLPLGEEAFDGAVSVESLHHFTFEEKVPLYANIRAALRRGGAFVLTDYMEEDEQASRAAFCEKARLLAGREGLYHIDTPLTVRRETQALLAGGFARVREEGRWGKTSLLVAERG